MPWSKILSSVKTPTTDGWSGRANRDKRRQVLLRSNLVNGDEALADAILNASTIQVFSARSLIISSGETDDCAYIILEGAVSVRVNGQLVDSKGQSDSIGELAARRAGSPRTADVRVSSAKLVVLKLEGKKFRALLEQHEAFRTNLESLVDTMNREKIAQLGTRRSVEHWGLISALVGIGLGIATHFALNEFSFSLAVAVTGFLLCQLRNPAFRYRMMAGSVLTALIGFVLFGSLSWSLSASGEVFEPFGIDVSADSTVELYTYLIGSVILLIAFGFCILADRREGN
jgi:hypothetical protein